MNLSSRPSRRRSTGLQLLAFHPFEQRKYLVAEDQDFGVVEVWSRASAMTALKGLRPRSRSCPTGQNRIPLDPHTVWRHIQYRTYYGRSRHTHLSRIQAQLVAGPQPTSNTGAPERRDMLCNECTARLVGSHRSLEKVVDLADIPMPCGDPKTEGWWANHLRILFLNREQPSSCQLVPMSGFPRRSAPPV